MTPVRLAPDFRAKPWGRTDLAPLFGAQSEKIGEVWFTGSGALPILVKFLFTSAPLSVQVHPPDTDRAPGKTEMWYIVSAEPGACIALGFRQTYSPDRVRAAAVSGEIVELLRWFPAQAGQVFFTPAGTVHAIGCGIVACEIQQNTDLTYRLYDYGSGRDLHLDQAMAVADLTPHPGPSMPRCAPTGNTVLARCRHFATDCFEVSGETAYLAGPEECQLLICVAGEAQIGADRYRAGEVCHVAPETPPVLIRSTANARFLRTCVPRC